MRVKFFIVTLHFQIFPISKILTYENQREGKGKKFSSKTFSLPPAQSFSRWLILGSTVIEITEIRISSGNYALSLSLSKIRCSWCARSIGRPIWKLNVSAGTWDFLARVFYLASRSRARASHSDPRCSSTSFRAPRLSCISINPPWHANNFVEKIERPMRRPRTLQLITWPRHDRHTASGYRTHNLLWLTGSTASRERIGDARFFCARILSLDRTHPIRVFFPSRLDFQRSRWILKGPPPIQWRIPQQFPLLSSRLPAFDRLRNFNVIPIEISVYLHFESLDCFEIVARLRGYVYLIRIGNL